MRADDDNPLIWQPSAKRSAAARITAFQDWLARAKGLRFADYDALCLGLWDTCPRTLLRLEPQETQGRCRTSLEGGNRGECRSGCSTPRRRYGDLAS